MNEESGALLCMAIEDKHSPHNPIRPLILYSNVDDIEEGEEFMLVPIEEVRKRIATGYAAGGPLGL